MFELRAVGDVQVDVQDRVPLVQQSQHRLHFRRVGLDVVAVQVEVLRGRAPAHFFRSDLVRPVPAAEALVAVYVQHRHEDERGGGERARRRSSVEHFTQREQAGVLAVDLAGVNAALHEHDRPLGTMGCGRVEHAIGGCDEREHRSAFGRASELEAAHLGGPRLLIRGAQPFDFVVATGALIARLLGDSAQRRVRGCARRCDCELREHHERSERAD